MRIKKHRAFLPICALLLATALSLTPPVTTTPAAKAAVPAGAQEAVVSRVIDGDTFVIESGEKVRLIGVDTPEKAGPYTKEEPMGKEATAFSKALLEGQTVYLAKDTSETDRYGRLLRYAYLSDGTFVNLRLVEEGLAKAVEFPPDTAYAEVFETAEAEAAQQNKGLWK